MRAIVCGASGALGGSCVTALQDAGYTVVCQGRDLSTLNDLQAVDAVVFAQGTNASGAIDGTSPETWDELWHANVLYVVDVVHRLLELDALQAGARIVILSSVWQELARADKIAYITTKAAVGGLVRALCADLGPRGIAVNALLPGVVDSPMTRSQLRPEQVLAITEDTPLGSLTTAQDVANAVAFLADPRSSGINGQSIVADRGWGVTRHV